MSLFYVKKSLTFSQNVFLYFIIFLQRLQTKVIKLVDVSYGGEWIQPSY